MPATLGSYTLHTIETGRFGLDGGAMFGVVPKPLWEKRIAPDERNRIPLHMRCLLLEGEGRVILLDDGMGDKYDEKFAHLYAVDEDAPTLFDELRRAGFEPEDVTDVVLTHLHFDHCGGSTRRVGDRLEVTFPNARHHVQRAQWDWTREPNPREEPSFMAENLEPLEGSGQLALVDGPGELFPGVEVLTFHGHTEAQQAVKISGPEGTLVYVADLLPTTHHLKPAWTMGYDVRPLVTMNEKAAFLQKALHEGWHLFFEHDPDTAVASLEAGRRGPQTTRHRSLDELF